MEAVPTQQRCGSRGHLAHKWDLLEQEVGTRPAAVCPHHGDTGKEGVTALSGAGPVPCHHQELLN